ncbi:MAG: tetratricopeptide repeat protein [Fuerstiella sp.]|nr:tetratricopeptide repeat protein [Fuerstiella sp.]MCP4785042.1 tetratricopeptide repeat protein [Fuerstiella sp.]MCP4858092.1 tetratricopeptide repeat protein [Fuerstiella sp.]
MKSSATNLPPLLLLAGMVCNVGCTSTGNLPARMKAFVVRSPVDELDPLINESDELSAEFRIAKKQLTRADDTMLKFARWREDLGDYQEAKEHYREILTDNPDSLEARMGIARIEFAIGRVAEAQAILAATARKHPDSPEVWMETGRIHSNQEEWEQAIQSLEKAVAIAPPSDPALFKATRYELGLALARNGQTEEARPHLTAAVGSAAALFNIGFVLHEQGHNQDASTWFQRALDSHPDERTHFQSIQMLTKLGAANSDKNSQLAAWPKQESTVDVRLTSYRSSRETPGVSAAGSTTPDSAGTVRLKAPVTTSPPAGRGLTYPSAGQPGSTSSPSRTSDYHTPSTPQWQGSSPSRRTATPWSASGAPKVVAPAQWRANP